MLTSIGKFSKSFFVKLLVGIIILPFVFWGMGDVFRGGNQNVIATVDSEKISTKEFVDYLRRLNLNEKQIKEVAGECLNANIPIRIGVNAGSLDKDILEKYGDAVPEALVESALLEVRYLEDVDFHNIKISVKHSNVPLMIESYRLLHRLLCRF